MHMIYVEENLAGDWVRTADLLCRKIPHCQLSRNNCPC